MKKPYSFGIGVLLFFVLHGKLHAQTAADAMTHPVILQYYTAEQLQYLEQHDSTGLKSVIYFFTASYIVEPIQCSECLPFDSLNFDIMKYDHLRKQDEVFVRTFDKYGFKLTLFPIHQLPYTYAIYSVPLVDPGDNTPAEEPESH